MSATAEYVGSGLGYVDTAMGAGGELDKVEAPFGEKGFDKDKALKFAGQTTAIGLKTMAGIGSTTAGMLGGPVGGAIGGGIGLVVGATIDSVGNGVSAYNTQKSISALNKLYEEARGLPSGQYREALLQVIDYCREKRGMKKLKSIGRATVVGAPAVGLYRAFTAIHKGITGTKGKLRRTYATALLNCAKRNDRHGKIARKVVGVLVQVDYEKVMQDAIFKALASG